MGFTSRTQVDHHEMGYPPMPHDNPGRAGGLSNHKILFVALSLDLGGVERHLSVLLPELSRRGWPVTLYCMNRLGPFADQLREAEIEIVPPPILREAGPQSSTMRLFGTATAAARLVSVLRRVRPTIVHFFLPEPYIIGAPLAIALNIPIRIMSRRGLNLYQKKWRGSRFVEQILHRFMTGVLANSRRVAADLASEGCRPDHIGIIYNGVGLPGLGGPIDRKAVRISLGLPADATVGITVANLVKYKGHAELLTALAMEKDHLPPLWRHLCVGRNEGEFDNLMAQAHSLGLSGHVQFLGARTDMAQLLAASDFAVLPSHEEGFSNAVIEAMGAGIAQVVTDVGGNAEAVIDGICGLVVPPGNAEALGNAIRRLATDCRERAAFGSAARQRAQQHFSLAACVDQYEAAYKILFAGGTLGELSLRGMPEG